MISFLFGTGLIDVNLTFGGEDSENPLSPLSLVTYRRGTNFQVKQDFPAIQIKPALNSIWLVDLDTALWIEPGQYDFSLEYYDGPITNVITSGLMKVIKPNQEIPSYGIERRRKEHYRP